MHLYSTLVLPIIKESLQNFIDTKIYLCRYDIDYKVNEEEYDKAECFGLGYQYELENGEKIVKIERIGEIENLGFMDVYSDKNGTLSCDGFEYKRGNPSKDEDFKKRINQAIRTQYNIFHKDESLDKTWKWVFIEVKQTNYYKSYTYYLKKTNHLIALNFDKTGNLIDTDNLKPFKITEDISYDSKKGIFINKGKEIGLGSGDLNNQKYLFLKYLISSFPAHTKQDELIKYIGIKGDKVRDDKKKFHDLKDRIIKDIFIKKLNIDENIAKNIIESKSGLVRINGDFI